MNVDVFGNKTSLPISLLRSYSTFSLFFGTTVIELAVYSPHVCFSVPGKSEWLGLYPRDISVDLGSFKK